MIEAGMAVIPPRFPNLKKSIPLILPQVDKLYVHINKYKGEIPEILLDNKIEISLSEENKNAFMKMRAMPYSEADYFLTMDDDILYPVNYVKRMTEEVAGFNEKAVVCVHGSRFKTDKRKGFIKRRKMYSFWDVEAHTVQVMMPGNGTCCYPRKAFLDVDNFNEGLHQYNDIDDVYMMYWLHKKGFSIYTIKRPSGWLKQLPSAGSSLQKKRPLSKIDTLAKECWPDLKKVWQQITSSN